MIVNDFMGLSGYVWWQGVVEDRNDPLKLGRCRVRVLGFHSEDKKKIPTDELPWAYPAMPLTAMPGTLPAAMVEGTWVMGFFRDGEHAQDPVITHKIDLGMVTKNNKRKGFNDPEENNSRPTNKNKPDKVGESNVSTIALGDKGKSDVPDTDREYPYNHVLETESGHVVELNDTPGGESVSVTHKSGSYVMIDKDGNLQTDMQDVTHTATKVDITSLETITEKAIEKVENISNVLLTGAEMVVDNLVVTGGVVARNIVGVESVTGAIVSGRPAVGPTPAAGEAATQASQTIKNNIPALLDMGITAIETVSETGEKVMTPLEKVATDFEDKINDISEPTYPRLLNLKEDEWIGEDGKYEKIPDNDAYLTLEYLDTSRDTPVRKRIPIMKISLTGNTASIDFEIQPTYRGNRLLALDFDRPEYEPNN